MQYNKIQPPFLFFVVVAVLVCMLCRKERTDGPRSWTQARREYHLWPPRTITTLPVAEWWRSISRVSQSACGVFILVAYFPGAGGDKASSAKMAIDRCSGCVGCHDVCVCMCACVFGEVFITRLPLVNIVSSPVSYGRTRLLLFFVFFLCRVYRRLQKQNETKRNEKKRNTFFCCVGYYVGSVNSTRSTWSMGKGSTTVPLLPTATPVLINTTLVLMLDCRAPCYILEEWTCYYSC